MTFDPTAAVRIQINAEMRYWEDARVNGVADEDGTLVPGRHGNDGRITIDLETGTILDWPGGTTADIHYKVCDAGQYWLLDATGRRIARYRGHYVPNEFLCHGDNGYGDYIIFKVNGVGKIEQYSRPSIGQDRWAPLEAGLPETDN
jgi:hypothetical protein